MVWQKIDDQFGVSQKVIRIPRKRRQQCVGLWTLAGNYAVRALTDGRLEEHELDELDAKDTDIDELVRVGLWHRPGDDCTSGPEQCRPAPPGGISIHDFLVYNPSREKTVADREAERVRKANQRQSKRSPSGTPPGRDPVSEHPVPSQSRPVPSPLTDTTNDPESSHVGDRASPRTDLSEEVISEAKRAGVDDLPAVLGLLEPIVGDLNPRHGIELAQVILRRARTPVLQPTAYIARACEKRDEIRRIAVDVLDLPGVA
ncbi:hypothetical protein DEJ30_12060 [Curtobacterium sp. MCPF17_003]|uniref:hypothetical protein n=1 Tax=Curtobacterium sp. MCPF17_003 TaxID=2175637 RepID=UPI000D89BD7C|nr:hypothetical protein [Curtobacterium sp. MCPF17_003]PYY63641.1 hypothetical protein DEJ30_12060 [Curtobacterium sp. MCPF17_003]